MLLNEISVVVNHHVHYIKTDSQVLLHHVHKGADFGCVRSGTPQALRPTTQPVPLHDVSGNKHAEQNWHHEQMVR